MCLLSFDPGQRVGIVRQADIEDELSRLPGGRKVDLRNPMDLSPYFRDEVASTARVVRAEPDAT